MFALLAVAPNANILGACTLLAAPKPNGVTAVVAGAAAVAAMPPNGDATAVEAAGAPKPPNVVDGTVAVGLAGVWPNWN